MVKTHYCQAMGALGRLDVWVVHKRPFRHQINIWRKCSNVETRQSDPIRLDPILCTNHYETAKASAHHKWDATCGARTLSNTAVV